MCACVCACVSTDGRGVSRIDRRGKVCCCVCVGAAAGAEADVPADVDVDVGAYPCPDPGAEADGIGSSMESPGLPTTLPSSSSKKVPAQLREGRGIGSGDIFSLFCWICSREGKPNSIASSNFCGEAR